MSHSTFLSMRALTDALVAKLKAIRWNAEAAFDQVTPFDVTDLELAIQELAATGNRVCLVVIHSEQFEHEVSGHDLHITHSVPITLLLADKNFSDRQSAFFGDQRTAGALTLRDLVLGLDPRGNPNFLGKLTAQTYVAPTNGMPFIVNQELRDKLSGFGVWSLSCDVIGGAQQMPLGDAPIV